MPSFIRGLPTQGGPLVSSDVRNNFLALDARTGKIAARATVPASTSITIDAGRIYFSDRISIDYPGEKLLLGNSLLGISPFVNIGFFKDVAIVLRLVFDQTEKTYSAEAVFIEGPEKSSATSQPELIPIRGSDLPVARFVVRHNGGSLTLNGQIEPISQSSINDFRNYLDVGGISYFSASVGDRKIVTDQDGVLTTDGYGDPIFLGQTIGSFVSDGYESNPIQDAIDSLSSGGTIFIKRGTYYISSTITIPENIQLIGEGPSTVIQMLDVFSGPLFNITGNNVTLSNLSIKGTIPSVLVASESLVRFSGVQKCTVKDCCIENGIVGLEYDLSNRNISVNNYLSDNTLAISISSGSENNIFIGNQFENNDNDFDNEVDNQIIGNVRS